MSSIGARHLVAACAKLLAFTVAVSLWAADCPPVTLSPQAAKQRFDELGKSAQLAMQQQRFPEALRDLNEAACLEPRDPRILYSLGSTEAALGHFLPARKAFTSVSALQPTNPLPLVMLVRVNVAMGDADSLKATLLETASRFAGDSNLHQTLAHFLLENKLPDLALAEALRSQKAGGAAGQSLMELAVLENTVGAYDDAIRNASTIEGQTTLPVAVRAAAAGVAGLSYASVGHPEAAIAHLRSSIQLDPSRENSYLALVFLLEKAQKYIEAVEVAQQGRRKLPESTLLLLPLGSDLVLTERYAAGVEVLQELLRRSPNEYEAYLKLADSFRKMGRSDREVAILRDLEKQKPGYPGIHVLLARAMLTIDPVDYPRTLEELSLAESGAPLDSEIFYLRGKIYLATNQNAEAVAALRRAIELKPMDPGPYYQLARLYQKLGHPELAKDILARMQYLKSNESR